MLKILALFLLVTAAACKTDDAPAQASSSSASRDTAAPAGPKPRSGKIEVPQHPPRLPGGDGGDKAGAVELRDGKRVLQRERVTTFDTDGDGVISDEERAAARQKYEAKMLARLDTNGDGKVSDEERAAARHLRAGAMHTRLDANGDGKVTADELTRNRRARGLQMEAVDKNRDGDASVEEIEAALRERSAQRMHRGSAGGDEAPAP